MKQYEAAYAGYVYEDPIVNWSPIKVVKHQLTKIDLTNHSPIYAGGMPVIVDGNSVAYIDTSDAHTAIEAITGNKKSICVYLPTIYFLGRAGENIFASDPKGELYSRSADYLKTQGYRVYCLDFRSCQRDGYNLLEYPALLYRAGSKDKAMELLCNLVHALASDQLHSAADSFWPQSAISILTGSAPIMFDTYPANSINILNWSQFTHYEQVAAIETLCQSMRTSDTAASNLKGVFATQAEKTLKSTQTTAASMLAPLLQNNQMARMLSHSTFQMSDFLKPRTALFAITDDTTSTCDIAVGTIISQLQTYLVDAAYHRDDGKLPTRMNFLLDEFLNFPIPNMHNALSAHRSRNIRYYLCLQSISGLRQRYKEYESLLANCGNVLFLGSTEREMLERISEQCGKTRITPDGRERPLISPEELMTLKKAWHFKEGIYLNLSESLRYFTTLPSIEAYNMSSSPPPSRHHSHPEIELYTPKDLIKDIKAGNASIPFQPAESRFSNKKDPISPSSNAESHDLQLELERKFKEVFGEGSFHT